ncbi:thiol-disulfide isomerase/thioredoxin [Actinoplanes lutulentus]|uniref:Thiol-disulfide isomerase/thioredoxin n=1 Tax=Actinoplanes lutulentus TaxID=1287878 RepID=A0A327YZZ7_9ACTN|nr:TlpA disulfide reductase family protein [Actinoplanes lutulentus]MBB2945679.1 thiol-disulfide isomerase/thioredoxin [Actinoplanes lutulentus]RAK27276.1 thiol-disulfide isomerase/thioredoxin [Actinoplanes lutulentus]
MIRFARALPAVVALGLLSACTAAVETSEPETPSPFAACDFAVSSGETELPDLSLPCFTGGQEVAVSGLRGPAVINVWASWCGPCREELPIMQGLADRTEGELTVLGVASRDPREASASFATDKDVSLPTLYDPDQKFAIAVKAAALPATVFVDAGGAIYVHRDTLDVDELIKLVGEHTGVTVTR